MLIYGSHSLLQFLIVMTMNKKWAVKRITVNLTSSEAFKLDEYCRQTGRPATDVIRELIRGLQLSKCVPEAGN